VAPRIITPADEARDIVKNDVVELIEDLPVSLRARWAR
jgi:hypothetical protein